MSYRCSRIVASVGPGWGTLGWSLLASWALFPLTQGLLSGQECSLAMCLMSEGAEPLVVPHASSIAMLVLWIGWWLIDAADQQAMGWVAVGVPIAVLSELLPDCQLGAGAAWYAYWRFGRD